MGIFWNRNVSRDKAGDLGITKSRGSHWAVLDKIRLIIWKCQTGSNVESDMEKMGQRNLLQ